jgi:hypothetical protein
MPFRLITATQLLILLRKLSILAEGAWDGKLGAWAQEGENLLLGYEF